jgi:hypothetical protein
MVRLLPEALRTDNLRSQLVAGLMDVQRAFSLEAPDYLNEIKLRERPLQEQWEAVGPGLWYQLKQILKADLLVEQARVILVQPVLGGFGRAHLQANCCHIEAVLTNADPILTEVLRLFWLLAQLDFDRPIYSQHINSMRLNEVAGMAMLPPVLQAAQNLGFAQLDDQTILRAMIQWRLQPEGNHARALAEVLMVWWETYQSGDNNWTVALTGLDRMLAD